MMQTNKPNKKVKISREVEELSQIVKDNSLSARSRLDAFEDIISLDIGDTSLNRARNLERDIDIRQLYIKYEGENPTGTHKDRIAFSQVQDALRRGYDIICIATCGNYGMSMSYATDIANMKCKIYIPEQYHTKRIVDMEQYNVEIIRVPGTYEDAVRISSQQALEHGWYDANPGGVNTSLQIMTYSLIANEIYDQLRDAPRIIAMPVSNGTLLAGVYRGFMSLYKRGKTSRVPRIIAGSAAKKNPIISSFLAGLDYCQDLDPSIIKETAINEPLINWHSYDGNEALSAIIESEGSAYNISDNKMIAMSSFLHKHEGYRIIPAATAGLVALLEMNKKHNLVNDRYVAVITGKY